METILKYLEILKNLDKKTLLALAVALLAFIAFSLLSGCTMGEGSTLNLPDVQIQLPGELFKKGEAPLPDGESLPDATQTSESESLVCFS
jgi:hypothetical protein